MSKSYRQDTPVYIFGVIGIVLSACLCIVGLQIRAQEIKQQRLEELEQVKTSVVEAYAQTVTNYGALSLLATSNGDLDAVRRYDIAVAELTTDFKEFMEEYNRLKKEIEGVE